MIGSEFCSAGKSPNFYLGSAHYSRWYFHKPAQPNFIEPPSLFLRSHVVPCGNLIAKPFCNLILHSNRLKFLNDNQFYILIKFESKLELADKNGIYVDHHYFKLGLFMTQFGSVRKTVSNQTKLISDSVQFGHIGTEP